MTARAQVFAGAVLGCCLALAGAPSHPARAQAVPPPDLPATGRAPDAPVTVGVVTDNYPYSFGEDGGAPRGFAVDLLAAVEQTMGLRLSRVTGSTAALHRAFVAGELDMLQSYADSPAREAHADFSVPYLTMAGSIFVRRDLDGIEQLGDLRGRRVLVHRGSLGEQLLREAGLGDSVVYVESVEAAFRGLEDGRGDATLATRLTGLMAVHQMDLRQVVAAGAPVPGYQVRYCFGVRDGDRQLLARLNEGLAIIERTGVADEIYQRWFGPVEPRRYSPLQIALAVSAGLAVALAVAIWSLRRQRSLAERLRQQEAQLHRAQKLEAVGTLSSGIAHDFNNILTTIIGNAELLKADVPPASVMADSVTDILRASERARQLVAQILTFSRQQETRRAVVPLMPVVEEAVHFLRAATPSTIEIAITAGDEDLRAEVDATQLHQAVINVGSNAIYAMREAPGRLDIKVQAVDLGPAAAEQVHVEPGRYACLTFRDTGRGIAADILPRVFDPFFTTKPQGEGTGLGLAVVLGIMHAHHGGVTVTSAAGVGTEVRLYLPASERPGDVTDAEDEAPRGDGRRVLVIDDEAGIARSVGLILERLGYDVTTSTDPAEALDSFAARPDAADVVLTDLTMPQLSGLEVARRLQASRPGVPVVLMSGLLSDRERRQAALAGIRSTIDKPPPPALLARVVDAALRHRDDAATDVRPSPGAR